MNDRNYRSYWQETGLRVDSFEQPENPDEWDDLLKFSNCSDVKVLGVTIPSGASENAVDAVRGKDYRWVGCDIGDGKVSAMTLKGAIDGWHIEDSVVRGKIEVGQFDDYWAPGRAPTRRGYIVDSRSGDGKPIVVELWDADAPLVIGSEVRIKRIPKWIWFPYFLFRWVGVSVGKKCGGAK